MTSGTNVFKSSAAADALSASSEQVFPEPWTHMPRTLVLCRTPFQAKIALEIVRETGVLGYDLVYFTYNDTARDRHYFELLKELARYAHYISAEQRNKEAIHHFFIWRALPAAIKEQSYGTVMLASIDSYLFRKLFSHSPAARLITFDDGTANISLDSSYHAFEQSRLAPIYDFLLGCPSVSKMKRSVFTHFSVYPGYENIVPASKISYIDPWKHDLKKRSQNAPLAGPSFFVGSPFNEAVTCLLMGPDDPEKIVDYCRVRKIDYYITHPREVSPLDIGTRQLASEVLLAEELIMNQSGAARPVVYAWFSTVLFNLSSDHVDKIYLSVGDGFGEKGRIEMARKAGCRVVKL